SPSMPASAVTTPAAPWHHCVLIPASSSSGSPANAGQFASPSSTTASRVAAALRQDEGVPGEPVSEADVGLAPARDELLRPQPVVVAPREQVVGERSPLRVESPVVCDHHHAGRAVEQIERGVTDVGRDELAQAVAPP